MNPKALPTNRAAALHAVRHAGQRLGIVSERPERQMYPAVCAECGKETEVPFKPSEDRPVYCRDCYNAHHRK